MQTTAPGVVYQHIQVSLLIHDALEQGVHFLIIGVIAFVCDALPGLLPLPRDLLHDLLGHTLSLITLKSELANKLFDIDAQVRQLLRCRMQPREFTAPSGSIPAHFVVQGEQPEDPIQVHAFQRLIFNGSAL